MLRTLRRENFHRIFLKSPVSYVLLLLELFKADRSGVERLPQRLDLSLCPCDVFGYFCGVQTRFLLQKTMLNALHVFAKISDDDLDFFINPTKGSIQSTL
jgi:hypothetical protein